MRTKKLSFKHKKEIQNISVVVFDSVEDATKSIESSELLRLINFGSEQLARLNHIGIDPFKMRKTKYKLDASKLDENTIKMLREKGAI